MTAADVTQWLETNTLLTFSILIPLISAIFSALASWLSVKRALRSEKERREHEAVSQIAGFRQRWINDLRNALSEFQSYGIHPGTVPVDEREFFRLGTKIELLMNPNDEDYKELQDLMYDFWMHSGSTIVDKFRVNPKFIDVSQRILKREWERLKDEVRSPSKFVKSKENRR